MELTSKRLEPAGISAGPRLMAVWPGKSPAHKGWYRTYVFNAEVWERANDNVRQGWLSVMVTEFSEHFTKLGVALSEVRWEMLHPIKGSQ